MNGSCSTSGAPISQTLRGRAGRDDQRGAVRAVRITVRPSASTFPMTNNRRPARANSAIITGASGSGIRSSTCTMSWAFATRHATCCAKVTSSGSCSRRQPSTFKSPTATRAPKRASRTVSRSAPSYGLPPGAGGISFQVVRVGWQAVATVRTRSRRVISRSAGRESCFQKATFTWTTVGEGWFGTSAYVGVICLADLQIVCAGL
jgi:hypothetical protein